MQGSGEFLEMRGKVCVFLEAHNQEPSIKWQMNRLISMEGMGVVPIEVQTDANSDNTHVLA